MEKGKKGKKILQNFFLGKLSKGKKGKGKKGKNLKKELDKNSDTESVTDEDVKPLTDKEKKPLKDKESLISILILSWTVLLHPLNNLIIKYSPIV